MEGSSNGERKATAVNTAESASNKSSSSKKLWIAMALGIVCSFCYTYLRPPSPRICGTLQGSPVTASRIVLRDGRYLAFKETGVPKDQAQYKIIFVHGSGGSRHGIPPVSKELMEELNVYMVSYDRAGYGQSDPHPGRDVKSEIFDIQDLADALQLGKTFYLVTNSMGGYSAWACLKYIPERLAGVVMFAPPTNFWWSRIPPREAYEAFMTQAIGDKLALLVAHYTPSLLYFWMTQKWFPTSSTMGGIHKYSNQFDREAMLEFMKIRDPLVDNEAMQQGIFESMIRDKMVMFGNWEFDPSEVKDPFPDKNGTVHIFHGDGDYLVPVSLQRYVHRSLPWLCYHELPEVGHMLFAVPGLVDKAIRCMVTNSCDC